MSVNTPSSINYRVLIITIAILIHEISDIISMLIKAISSFAPHIDQHLMLEPHHPQ